jgi:hypothetical protein
VKKSVRTWVIVPLLAATGVALLAYALFSWSANPSRNPRHLRHAIEQAAVYLSSVEVRGDDAWVATQGAAKLGPEFRLWAETLQVTPLVLADRERDPLTSGAGAGVEGNLWTLRWLAETPLPALTMPELPPGYVAQTALSDADILSILQTKAYAVACHRLGDTDREAWLQDLSQERNSYVLTHQLIALVLGRHQGCIDAATTASIREGLATRLWFEQATDRGGFTDLSIERLAALCYAQLCPWIRDEWLNEMIDEQQPSGSWGDELNPNVHPRVIAREEHGAALAFYVLASVWSERFADQAGPQLPKPQ